MTTVDIKGLINPNDVTVVHYL